HHRRAERAGNDEQGDDAVALVSQATTDEGPHTDDGHVAEAELAGPANQHGERYRDHGVDQDHAEFEPLPLSIERRKEGGADRKEEPTGNQELPVVTDQRSLPNPHRFPRRRAI